MFRIYNCAASPANHTARVPVRGRSPFADWPFALNSTPRRRLLHQGSGESTVDCRSKIAVSRSNPDFSGRFRGGPPAIGSVGWNERSALAWRASSKTARRRSPDTNFRDVERGRDRGTSRLRLPSSPPCRQRSEVPVMQLHPGRPPG